MKISGKEKRNTKENRTETNGIEKSDAEKVCTKKETMKDLPEQDRPYERCWTDGAGSLTDAQLLAVILRTGSKKLNALELASKILDERSPDGGLLRLMHLERENFLSFDGIGKVKAVQMLCIGELSRRIWRQGKSAGQKLFRSPADVALYCMEDMRHLEQEQVRAMYFDTKQKLIRDTVLSKGTVNSAVISPREIFKQALACNGVSLVLIHNHPSGDPSPSQEDKQLTMQVKAAGEVLGILLLDHIIIGDTTYISLLNEGML